MKQRLLDWIVAKNHNNPIFIIKFTVTKPIYDINANTLKIKDAEYGYASEPQTAVTWESAKSIQNVVASLSDRYGTFEDSFQKKVVSPTP